MLARERQFRQVLGSRRRTYGHRDGVAGADVGVHRGVEITGEIRRQGMRREEPVDRVGSAYERELAVHDFRDRQLDDERVQSVRLDETAVGVGRDNETVRNGKSRLDEPSKRVCLTANQAKGGRVRA